MKSAERRALENKERGGGYQWYRSAPLFGYPLPCGQSVGLLRILIVVDEALAVDVGGARVGGGVFEFGEVW